MTNPEEASTHQEAAEIPVPADGGQDGGVEATNITSETTEADPAPAVEYINPDDLSGKMHKIVVDGEEVEVSFEELTQGYNSNRAATQKFQEAAKLRQEAETAVGLAQKVLQGTQPQPEPEPEPVFESEAERRIYQLEQTLAERERREAQAAADSELASVVNGIKTDLQATPEEIQQVLAAAAQKRLPFDALAGELLVQRHMRGQVQSAARQEAAASEAAVDQARDVAAVAASAAMGAGGQNPQVVSEQVVRPANAREALEATLKQLGVE